MEVEIFTPLENSIIDLIDDRLSHWKGIIEAQISFFSSMASLSFALFIN